MDYKESEEHQQIGISASMSLPILMEISMSLPISCRTLFTRVFSSLPISCWTGRGWHTGQSPVGHKRRMRRWKRCRWRLNGAAVKKVGLAKRGGLLAASALLLSSQWQLPTLISPRSASAPRPSIPLSMRGCVNLRSWIDQHFFGFSDVWKVSQMRVGCVSIWGSSQLACASYIMPGLLHCLLHYARLAAQSQCSDWVHSYMT